MSTAYHWHGYSVRFNPFSEFQQDHAELVSPEGTRWIALATDYLRMLRQECKRCAPEI